MAIAQFFLPPPLCSPVCDLTRGRLRCDWESFIFSCDHDRKAEELDPLDVSVADGENDLHNWFCVRFAMVPATTEKGRDKVQSRDFTLRHRLS